MQVAMASEFHMTRRIEFSDTDMAGVVHFSRFFVLMESVEHAFFRSLGTSVTATIDGDVIGWPRVSASCEYLSPARFEDEIDIHLSVLRKSTKTLTYGFDLKRGDVLVARGKVTAACCLCNPGEPIRSIPIPDEIADRIQEAAGPEA